MAGLGETVFTLSQRRRDMAAAGSAGPARLQPTTPSGSNPGRLSMLAFVPPGLPRGAPLVVVLHGCTQTAEGYDHGSGWSQLAARHGFAVLYPEQDRSNNANLCFNWFNPEDVRRDSGEASSIKQMIDQMIQAHALNPARVYITGLSAGGAMTSALLATYPEAFAGGAIIAGLPYGAGSGMQGAFEAMRGPKQRSAAAWGALVRAASPHRGRWPSIQIWHGGADTTVGVANLDALALQWSDLLGVAGAPEEHQNDRVTHRLWRGADGAARLETYLVAGLAHGTPLDTAAADLDQSCGAAGPFMLEAGISSTWHIAQAWGLLTQASRPKGSRPAGAAAERPDASAKSGSVADMIRAALRAAGLPGANGT